MDEYEFNQWSRLFDAETTEILGDAKFTIRVAKIASQKPVTYRGSAYDRLWARKCSHD